MKFINNNLIKVIINIIIKGFRNPAISILIGKI